MKALACVSIVLSLVACGSGVERKNQRSGASVFSSPNNQNNQNSDDATGDKDQSAANGHDNKDNQDKPGKDPDGSENNDDQSVEVPTGRIVTIGVRNFQQINATMSVLTGVPKTTATVLAQYNALSTALPTNNDAGSFSGSNQVGVFKMAVEYCDALVKDQTKRAVVFGNFNFAAVPATALNAAGKQQVADALISRFWGKNLAGLPAHEQSVTMLTTLMDDILSGKTANQQTAALTSGMVTAACTAALASAPVMLF